MISLTECREFNYCNPARTQGNYDSAYLFVLDDRLAATRRNAMIVIEQATVYPFKIKDSKENIICLQCSVGFKQPEDFRNHAIAEHFKPDLLNIFRYSKRGIPNNFVRSDCTRIVCRQCCELFANLTEFCIHYNKRHDCALDISEQSGIQEFNFSTKWKCVICGLYNDSFTELCRHTETHYCNFRCKHCSTQFGDRSLLLRHVLTCTKNKIPCNVCNATFDSIKDRRDHLIQSVRCQPHKCNECSETFPNGFEFRKHMTKVHTSKRQCPCGTTFDKYHQYANHMRRAHVERSVCKLCNKQFTTRTGLALHEVVHTGEKKFLCSVCPKKFGTKKNLSQHMLMHSDSKNYKCDYCDQEFRHVGNRKKHMRARHQNVSFGS